MSTITTRSGKGSPLTHNEVDANFTNLNTDKYQSGDDVTFGSFTSTGIDDNATSTALTVTDSGIAATLTTAAQPNITSVGTLTGFTSTGIDDNATSTAITIDSSENVGIGGSADPFSRFYGRMLGVSSASSSFLEINAATGNTSGIDFGVNGARTAGITSNTTETNISTLGSTPLNFATNTSTRMTIASGGNVGIGTSSPSQKMHINAPSGSVFLQVSSGSSDGYLGYDSVSGNQTLQSDTGLHFATGASFTERMRIDSSGSVHIGPSANDSQGYTIDLSPDTQKTAGIDVSSASPNVNLDLYAGGSPSNLGGWSGQIRFLTGGSSSLGTECMRIDDSGNVGIGTSSPNSKLTLSTGDKIFVPTGEALNFGHTDGSTNTERMRIDSSGNVGIGTSSPTGVLTSYKSTDGDPVLGHFYNDNAGTATEATVYITNSSTVTHGLFLQTVGTAFTTNGGFVQDGSVIGSGSGASGGLSIMTRANAHMRFYTNGHTNERMRIDSSGNLLIGTTDDTPVSPGTASGASIRSGGQIQASSSSDSPLYLNRFTTTGKLVGIRYAGVDVGSIDVTASATSYVTSSDARLKENIVDAPAGNIDAIRVRSFDWKADGTHQTYGMVAQELIDVAPEAVSQGETDDDMWGVDYSKLVPMMIKEIQDLRARVAQLEGA